MGRKAKRRFVRIVIPGLVMVDPVTGNPHRMRHKIVRGKMAESRLRVGAPALRIEFQSLMRAFRGRFFSR
jgi:hypothetical protein